MWFPSKIDPKQERIIEVGNEDKVPENYIHESPVPKVNYSRDWRKTKIGGQNKNSIRNRSREGDERINGLLNSSQVSKHTFLQWSYRSGNRNRNKQEKNEK